ncbi:hypothetical protein GPECTOR_804g30 [Gonium pectorale]|uniref:Uncharacterized protein n=1 Tax=Gonium pectorale TaxID=33097 RepID=A0A150FU21_GONPE|nr:hypothetical protein GPECTOR_804g30 [Gonium pectorale]|eukprot:KXZ41097.1 hypothetical protein GPECTOR_804g30 [Gonium pectorale]
MLCQTKIFGGFTRWFFDLPPPDDDVQGRTVLATASTAYRAAVASAPLGPVHLNLQFRELLAPVPAPWQRGPFLRGLAQWQASQLPYTAHISGASLPAAGPGPSMAAPGGIADGAAGMQLDAYAAADADVAALRGLRGGGRAA